MMKHSEWFCYVSWREKGQNIFLIIVFSFSTNP